MDRLSHALKWTQLPEVIQRADEREKAYRKHASARSVRNHQKRVLVDASYAIGVNIRNLLSSWGVRKQGARRHVNRNMEILVGCSWEEFRVHISSQFRHGMNWENYGQWHLDHVVPLCRFDLTKHLLPAFHYTNTRPVWADLHRQKSKWERRRK